LATSPPSPPPAPALTPTFGPPPSTSFFFSSRSQPPGTNSQGETHPRPHRPVDCLADEPRDLRMNIRTLCRLLLAPALALLAACGGNAGTATNRPDDGGFDAQTFACGPAPCPFSATWDYTLCACVAEDGGTTVVPPGDVCTNLVCPSGTYVTSLNGSCVCQVFVDVPDATEDQTAQQDAPYV